MSNSSEDRYACNTEAGIILWFLVGWPKDGAKPFHCAGPDTQEAMERVAQSWVDHFAGWAVVTLVSSVPQNDPLAYPA